MDNFLTNTLLLAAKRNRYVYQQLLAVAHLSKPAQTLLSDPQVILAMMGKTDFQIVTINKIEIETKKMLQLLSSKGE